MFSMVVVMVMGAHVVEGGPPGTEHCRRLQERMALRYSDVLVIINGERLNVTVMGEGGGARAAAAALFVSLRYGLGYAARLQQATPDLCQLSDLSNDWRQVVTMVAPVATIAYNKCINGVHQLDSLTSLSSAMIDVSLHMMAHIWDSTCTSLSLSNSLSINTTVLEDCQFTTSDAISTNNSIRNSTTRFAILVRKQTEIDILVADELEKQIEESIIPLHIIYYDQDLEFRKLMQKLRQQQKNFLFLDENIWNGISNIYYVHLQSRLGCRSIDYSVRKMYAGTFRTGNGFNMRLKAPAIYNLVNDAKPNATQLLQILENEISVSKIEEAACMWALSNFEQFKQRIPSNFNDINLPFVIYVYLCNDDPYYKEYIKDMKKISKIFKQTFRDINFNINYTLFNCEQSDFLANKFMELSHSHSIRESIIWNSIVGSITWGSTLAAESGAKVAEQVGLPMLLAGPTPPETPVGSIVHSATGTLTDMTRAYMNFLHLCDWSRIAIISDNSTYSKTFFNNLHLTENSIIFREVIVTLENVNWVLESLKKGDARIILINAHWKITNTIMCTASNLGMTDARFVWITRNWRYMECDSLNSDEFLYHYTLEMTSRRSSESENFQSFLFNHTELTPAKVDSSSLMDALVQLGYWVASVIRQYPSHIYTLHDKTGTQKLSKNFDMTGRTSNVSHNYPLVVVAKWLGSKGNVVAIWHFTPDNIEDITWNRNGTETCEQILKSKPPEDRSRCLIQTGDPFAPRCHQMLFFISIILVTFTFAVLFKVYRNRQFNIQLLKRQHQEYLMNSRQRATSLLENYIVKRNAVQLMHVIGLGSFGQVRFAMLHRTDSETVVVAAKEPRAIVSLKDENIFLREACVLAPLNHKNVIRLVGVCLEDGPPMVLMEHAFYNDLQHYLEIRRQFVDGALRGRVTPEQALEVSDEELTRFAREAAGALEYLTICRLVHRDIRAGNCLVDQNRSLKLADFGMARELDSEEPQYVTQRRALFPVIWMAPESIKSGVFSPASDVWSLGVLLLEVATFGSRPFGDWSVDVVVRYIRYGGHPPLPPDTSIYTSRLVLACWHPEPECRPSAAQIYKYLLCNPHAISPALLPPHPPESPYYFIR